MQNFAQPTEHTLIEHNDLRNSTNLRPNFDIQNLLNSANPIDSSQATHDLELGGQLPVVVVEDRPNGSQDVRAAEASDRPNGSQDVSNGPRGEGSPIMQDVSNGPRGEGSPIVQDVSNGPRVRPQAEASDRLGSAQQSQREDDNTGWNEFLNQMNSDGGLSHNFDGTTSLTHASRDMIERYVRQNAGDAETLMQTMNNLNRLLESFGLQVTYTAPNGANAIYPGIGTVDIRPIRQGTGPFSPPVQSINLRQSAER